jgi:hypothetical protein
LVRTSVIVVLVICVWLALMPPFFTHGACTAEFDAADEALKRARPALATLEQAQAYLTSRSLLYQVLSAERCERTPPREVEVCSGGPTLLVSQPVKNRVCRFYRDSGIHLQLGFNGAQQLVRMQTDMHPYRMLKVPMLRLEIDWAK